MTKANLVKKHYDKYIKLYEYWSGENGGGYHFGFPKNFWEIFDNEKMTKNLSEAVIDRASLGGDFPQKILDAGCGASHLGRLLAKKFNQQGPLIYGITLSEEQISLGKKLNEREGLAEKIILSLGDFEKTNFADDFFDAIFFVDSICHGEGESKKKALSEAFRILKPGGRLVITDGFLVKKKEEIDFLGKYLSEKMCRIFAVPQWSGRNLFFREMVNFGFKNVQRENFSWKIAPSVFHAFCFKFPGSLKNYFLGRADWEQVRYFFLAGIFAPLLGMHPCFRYEIVVAQKPKKLKEKLC